MINFACPFAPRPAPAPDGLPALLLRAFVDVLPFTSVHWGTQALSPPRWAGPAPSAGAPGAALDAGRPGPFPVPPWPRLRCGFLTLPSSSLPSSTLLACRVPFLSLLPAPPPAPPLPESWAPPRSTPAPAGLGSSAGLAAPPPVRRENFQTRGSGMGRAPLLLLLLPPWLFVPALRRGGESAGARSRGGGANTAGAGGRAVGRRSECERWGRSGWVRVRGARGGSADGAGAGD